MNTIVDNGEVEECMARYAALLQRERDLDCQISTDECVLKEVREILNQGSRWHNNYYKTREVFY